jgi:beta-1,4-mannosyltransferase
MSHPPSRLRILARPAFKSSRSNPYTSLLYTPMLQAGHAVVEYRLDRALLGKWDVVHVHWPESVFNHSLPEALPTTESLLVALRRARRNGAKVLWTVHNLRAHEHPIFEARFRERYFDLLDGIVALSEAGLQAAVETYPRLAALPAWVVPHPHYRGRYPDTMTREQARQALGIAPQARVVLNFGRVFEYKNLPALFAAVKQEPSQDWAVIVAGRPRSAELATQLQQDAQTDARIRLEFDFIPDERVQRYFRAADVVVLPYREILNSGTALLALSFDRPVLLPEAGAGSELTRRVGAEWVYTYEGELSGRDIARALDGSKALPERTNGEHLKQLSTEAVSDALSKVYAELVAHTATKAGA